jgi:hypothetical protein
MIIYKQSKVLAISIARNYKNGPRDVGISKNKSAVSKLIFETWGLLGTLRLFCKYAAEIRYFSLVVLNSIS